jgi:hypothetical protein
MVPWRASIVAPSFIYAFQRMALIDTRLMDSEQKPGGAQLCILQWNGSQGRRQERESETE